MVMFAVFNVLMYRYTGAPDICVGTPIANRNREEVEGLIGLFINTLVLRTNSWRYDVRASARRRTRNYA